MATTYANYTGGVFNQYYSCNRSFTIDFWIYVFNSSDKTRYLVYWNTTKPYVILSCSIYNNKITIADYQNKHSATIDETIENNKLYHIAIMGNSTKNKITASVNGKICTLISSANANTFTFTTASVFKIGGETTSTSFNGIISNFRMCSFVRWISDFDPYQIYNDKPKNPVKFMVYKYTKALLHFDDPNNPLKDEISSNTWKFDYNVGTDTIIPNYNLGDTPPIMDVHKNQYIDKAIFLDSAHRITLNEPLFSLFGDNDRKDFTIEMFFRPYKYYYVNSNPLSGWKMLFTIDWNVDNYEVISYAFSGAYFATQSAYK